GWRVLGPTDKAMEITQADLLLTMHVDYFLMSDPFMIFDDVFDNDYFGAREVIDNHQAIVPCDNISCPTGATHFFVLNVKKYKELNVRVVDSYFLDKDMIDQRMYNGSIYTYDRGCFSMLHWHLHMIGQKWRFIKADAVHWFRIGALSRI